MTMHSPSPSSHHERAAIKAGPMPCHTACPVCARLSRHAAKQPLPEHVDRPLSTDTVPAPQTPRKPARRAEAYPNPYITPPREFVRALGQLMESEDTEFCGDECEDGDGGVGTGEVIVLGELMDGREDVTGRFADFGVHSADESDREGTTEFDDAGLSSNKFQTAMQEVRLPPGEPKYDVGDTVFIAPVGGVGASLKQFGPLTVVKRVHRSALAVEEAVGATAEGGIRWYYHLAWHVMEGINWCPDEYFWREDRLTR